MTISDNGAGKPGFKEGKWAVSPYNFAPEVRADMHLPPSIRLMDMTLREGRQVAGVSVGLAEVLEFARRIDEVGVPIVEMHHDLLDEIKGVKKLGVKFQVQALVHPTAALNPELCEKEIDLCNKVGSDIICLAFAISDYNYKLVESMGGLKITRQEALDRACEAVQYGKARQGGLISVNLMDFSRLDIDWLRTIVASLRDAGVDILRIDDICAPCIPAVYKYHAWEVKQVLGDIPMAIHSHDDFALGTAGQLAALEGGAEILEGCVNGLGERAGVPNLAVLASILEIMYGYDTGLDLEAMQEVSEWVADVWNKPLDPHMTGVGKTAFSHAAEVHYALPEGDEWSFNAWSPAVVGGTHYVPLCHYSGPKAIQRKVEEMGLGKVDDDAAERILETVRFELRFRRRELSDRLFTKIVEEPDARQLNGERPPGKGHRRWDS